MKLEISFTVVVVYLVYSIMTLFLTDKSARPDWLREELNNSEEAWIDDVNVNNRNHNNNNDKSADQRRRAEKEYNRRTKELYLGPILQNSFGVTDGTNHLY